MPTQIAWPDVADSVKIGVPLTRFSVIIPCRNAAAYIGTVLVVSPCHLPPKRRVPPICGNLGLFVSSADCAQLAAIIADRNSPQKHVWRADPKDIIAAVKRGHQTLQTIQ
jgi:hypothetical protein